MSQQLINVGSAPDDGTGEPLRNGLQKANANFTELYAAIAPLGYTPEDVANKDTDVTLAADSNTRYPSQQAVKTYVDKHPGGFAFRYTFLTTTTPPPASGQLLATVVLASGNIGVLHINAITKDGINMFNTYSGPLVQIRAGDMLWIVSKNNPGRFALLRLILDPDFGSDPLLTISVEVLSASDPTYITNLDEVSVTLLPNQTSTFQTYAGVEPAVTGAYVLDLYRGPIRWLNIVGATTFTTTNGVTGMGTWKVTNISGVSQNLTFPAGWEFVGDVRPTSIANNKTALLRLLWIDPSVDSVIAEWLLLDTNAAAAKLPLAGGTLTGNLIFSTDNTLDIGATGATRPRTLFAGTSVVSPLFTGALTGAASSNVLKAGDTMTGNLIFTDNSYDIGASGATRPRTLFAGTSVVAPAFVVTSTNVNAQTISYQVQASDNGKVVTMDSGSAMNLTVPAGLGAGFSCTVIQLGAGQVTFVASGVTINSVGALLKLSAQHAAGVLYAYAANTYNLAGSLA